MRANAQPHTVHNIGRTRLGAHPIIALYDQIQEAVGGREGKLGKELPARADHQPAHQGTEHLSYHIQWDGIDRRRLEARIPARRFYAAPQTMRRGKRLTIATNRPIVTGDL